VGFFTLEDVLEEVIQEEIEDEKDLLLQAARLDEPRPSSVMAAVQHSVQTDHHGMTGSDSPDDHCEVEDFDSCNFVDSSGSGDTGRFMTPEDV